MDVEQEKSSRASINIGESLAKARQDKNLSCENIASQLNLTQSVIEKIELNQFDMDAPLIFVRGYVASYAKKVGLDIDTITDAFDTQVNSGSSVSTGIKKLKSVSEFKRSPEESNSSGGILKLVVYFIVLILIVSVIWFGWKHFSNRQLEGEPLNEILLNSGTLNNNNIDSLTSQSKSSQVNPVVEKTDSNEDVSSLTDTSAANDISSKVTSGLSTSEDLKSTASSASQFEQSVAEQESGEQELAEQALDEQELGTQTAELENNTVTSDDLGIASIPLKFTFIGDCWVQVTDANEEILAVGVKKNGKVMSISGEPPISVILGDPGAVSQLMVRGESFDLSSYTPGRTAKFVIE
jgi:cytoskeleton protein RodZ